MRHFLRTLVLSTAALTVSAASAASTQVFFENEANEFGLVDVYIDGRLVFDDMFLGSPNLVATGVEGGTHTVVVTPYNVALGAHDLLSADLDFTAGTYVLSVGGDPLEGYALSLNEGTPFEE